MEYYTIKNFEKFQHYGDKKKPTWIKLHVSLLTDYEFGNLTETQQAHLLKVWLTASQNDGKVVASPSQVRRAIGARSPVNLELFEKKGFLVKSSRATPPNIEKDKEEEKEKEKDKGESSRGIPFEDLSLARTMREEIFKICPDTAGPEVERSWATEIQKMRRVKKLTTDQIVQTWDWARNDEFYCKIVSGPAELFRHWEKIRFKMTAEKEQSKKDDWRAYV